MTRHRHAFAPLRPLACLGLTLAIALPAPLAGAQAQTHRLDQQIAQARLDSWQQLLANGRQLDERAQLEQVNRFVNRALSYASDQSTWQTSDYWATPAEALGRGQGDCEDYALAKYFGLTQLGVPGERLRLTYVKDLAHNQAHMVLAYYAPDASEPLLLDSLRNEIQPASARRDLLPVYAFNEQGLFLASARQQQKPRSSEQIAIWREVRERAQADGSLALLQPPPQS